MNATRRKIHSIHRTMGYDTLIDMVKSLSNSNNTSDRLILQELLAVVISLTFNRTVRDDQFYIYELKNIGRVNKFEIKEGRGIPPVLLKPSNKAGDYVSQLQSPRGRKA